MYQTSRMAISVSVELVLTFNKSRHIKIVSARARTGDLAHVITTTLRKLEF